MPHDCLDQSPQSPFVAHDHDTVSPEHSSQGNGQKDQNAEGQTTYLQRFTLDFEYPVCFTRDLFAPGNPIFAETLTRREKDRRHRFAVLIDDGLAAAWATLPDRISAYAVHHAAAMQLAVPPTFIPGGERCKADPDLVSRLQRMLVEFGLDRHAFVVAIGGGALLDLVGYVAATVHRGIRLVRVPTHGAGPGRFRRRGQERRQRLRA